MADTLHQHVYFKPWRGEQYGGSSEFGLPVLVLGESHYEWLGGTLDENTTCEIIGDIVGGWTYAFWTKIAMAFLGRRPSQDEKSRFWNSIAFYNFIQDSVGFGPRNRPTLEMWHSAASPFREVLADLRPRCVVVLGKELWEHLPPFDRPGPALSLEGNQRATGLYQVGEAPALVVGIKHPSAIGWRYEEWHPWISQALLAARRL